MPLTLIKEDGTGKPDANSYAAAADGDAYHDGHLYASTWTAAITTFYDLFGVALEGVPKMPPTVVQSEIRYVFEPSAGARAAVEIARPAKRQLKDGYHLDAATALFIESSSPAGGDLGKHLLIEEIYAKTSNLQVTLTKASP